MNGLRRSIAAAGFAAVAAVASPPAGALAITAAGTADGFVLSLFVDQVPNSGCCGPLGIATNNLGQVVMQVFNNGNYVYNDVDNQHFNQSLSSAGFTSSTYGIAITNLNGVLYAGNRDQSGQLFSLNANGSSAGVVPGTGTGIAGHGIATNQATGHIVSASDSGIYDTNVTTGASSLIVASGGANIDGVAVSANGSVIYGARNGHIVGWNYSGTVVYDSGVLGALDGVGVIQGSTPFAGDLVANDNNGLLWLLDPVNLTSVIIANGGTRGDYVGVDSTDGSLFVTQTNSVYRLTCGPGCVFTNNVPEPASLSLLGLGLLGLFGVGRRNRA